MIRLFFVIIMAVPILASCSPEMDQDNARSFVNVENGQLILEGKPYQFVGVNLWYGMNLAAAGQDSGRQRLVRELDELATRGITNVRLMAGTEGSGNEPWRVQPALQTEPGKYDEGLLAGLDFLLAEMGRRDMKAVLVLSNFFQWTGGFAQYVSWADSTTIPYPNAGENTWDEFQLYAASFYRNKNARRYFRDFVSMLTARTNTLTGTPYIQDPTIMAWQLANEPRGFDGGEDYVDWIEETSMLLQELAPRQLVSIGGEGKLVPHNNMQFERISALPGIDYLTIHLWVENWSWFDPTLPEETFDASIARSMGYIADHVAIASRLGKPIVLEEFGMSRDNGSHNPTAPTVWRDRFFRILFDAYLHLASEGSPLAGLNIWSYSGEGDTWQPGATWLPGHPFTGDPPHEQQGWYSIHQGDVSTLSLIGEYATQASRIAVTR